MLIERGLVRITISEQDEDWREMIAWLMKRGDQIGFSNLDFLLPDGPAGFDAFVKEFDLVDGKDCPFMTEAERFNLRHRIKGEV